MNDQKRVPLCDAVRRGIRIKGVIVGVPVTLGAPVESPLWNTI